MNAERPSIYRRRWLVFDVPDFVSPSAVGQFKWSIVVPFLELARVQRAPWDYWVLYVKVGRHYDFHFGSGWRKHVAAMRAKYPDWKPLLKCGR